MKNRVAPFTLAGITVALVCVMFGTGNATTDEATEQYLSDLAAYYGVSPEAIDGLRDTTLPIEEYPVTLVVSGLVKMPPSRIASMREQGDSWSAIMDRRGLDAGSFYILIAAKIASETYAPILHKYDQTPQASWDEIDLTDADVINLANLKFIASHHDYSIFEVMALRDLDVPFVEINRETGKLKNDWLARQREFHRERNQAEARNSN